MGVWILLLLSQILTAGPSLPKSALLLWFHRSYVKVAVLVLTMWATVFSCRWLLNRYLSKYFLLFLSRRWSTPEIRWSVLWLVSSESGNLFKNLCEKYFCVAAISVDKASRELSFCLVWQISQKWLTFSFLQMSCRAFSRLLSYRTVLITLLYLKPVPEGWRDGI